MVVALGLACGCSAHSAAPRDGVLRLAYDMGPVFGCPNQPMEFKHEFTVANPFADRTLRLTLLSKSCGCVAKIPSQLLIQPRHTAVVALSASHSIASQPVTQTWSATYVSDDEPQVELVMSLEARLLPRLATDIVSEHSGDAIIFEGGKSAPDVIIDVLSRQPLTEEGQDIRVDAPPLFTVSMSKVSSSHEDEQVRLRTTRVRLATSDARTLARIKQNTETLRVVIQQGTSCSYDLMLPLRVRGGPQARPPVLYARLAIDSTIERSIQLSAEDDFSVIAVKSPIIGLTIATDLDKRACAHDIRVSLDCRKLLASLSREVAERGGVRRLELEVDTTHPVMGHVVVPLFLISE